jgi:indoleamine 2,3-dioxygenase
MFAPLSAYDIDPVTGFVPSADQPERLPPAFEAWELIAADLPPLIRSRRVRDSLRKLPLLDPLVLTDPAEQERALLILTMFAGAWVWGGTEPDLTIPAPVSVPLRALCAVMDRPPIVHYGGMALRNWKRVDKSLPLSADNVRSAINFLGGVDEEWFFLASMGVELEAAPMLPHLRQAVIAAQEGDDAALTAELEAIADAMEPVMAALARMREWCDPYVFFNRVRLYFTGWPEPGVIYEGVSAEPQVHVGGSAGQSALIQAIDAVVGVDHDGMVTGPYFKLMRRYMPGPHRRFVEDLQQVSRVRQRVEAGGEDLRAAYNRVLRQIDRFRAAHRRMAHDYVSVPSGKASGEKGTGGTDFTDFLDDARRETSRKYV